MCAQSLTWSGTLVLTLLLVAVYVQEWPLRVGIREPNRNVLLAAQETTIHGLIDAVPERDLDGMTEKDLMLFWPRRSKADTPKKKKIMAVLRAVKAQIVTSEEEDVQDRDSLRRLTHEDNPLLVDLAKVPVAVPTTTATADSERTESTRSFHDYVQSRCEIDMCVAIDFTGSNGKRCTLCVRACIVSF